MSRQCEDERPTQRQITRNGKLTSEGPDSVSCTQAQLRRVFTPLWDTPEVEVSQATSSGMQSSPRLSMLVEEALDGGTILGSS